jgi:hypothetical protein
MDDNNKPLSEKNFIHEGYSQNPSLLWIWLALVAIVACLFSGFSSWFEKRVEAEIKAKPFLEVTNREMSLFLWQNPTFMRSHAKNKAGYLIGFKYMEKETMELNSTEDFVVAPPDLLFLYHTWHRLVGLDYIPKPIPLAEFKEFIGAVEEWQPQHWPKAPKAYAEFLDELSTSTIQDLQSVSEELFPREVRQAFQGWKNYFKEGDTINHLIPTYAQVGNFLANHPFYARNCWRNIHDLAGEKYLETLTLGHFSPNDLVPDEQLPPFLKVALYNAIPRSSQPQAPQASK